MDFANFIGQTLDGKYKIERELGKGGMGTVYLATHVGTERPVAVKIIAPQFMERTEFVERFRREARAAGRLRHPNVVNVTDFGFADTKNGQVAYLVMEYLDGCTLGEILEEEQKLPVSWTLDILEQVCSAVHEAHNQGIIHRDLKPDNIWLEPNPSGGYTVKVLDFGIAKLEENMAKESANISGDYQNLAAHIPQSRATVADFAQNETLADKRVSTAVSESKTIAQASEQKTVFSEAGTLVQANPDIEPEEKTALFSNNQTVVDEQSDIGTKLITDQVRTEKSAENKNTDKALLAARETSELTRVGAVLGTPLFMSPEQCRGEKLSPRSDIYSLGVIAYRMLGGKTPFDGDFTSVMQSHREDAPPPLPAKKVPNSIKKVIYSALAKNPDDRPATAEAFASKLRAQSEGIWMLLRRALVIYSEHLPKFLGLTALLSLPIIILTFAMITLSFLRVSELISDNLAGVLMGVSASSLAVISAFCTYLIIGTTTWIVTQYLAVPLRPIRIRPAFSAAKKKWKTFAGTGILSTILTFVIGILTCGIGFLVTSVLWTLLAPVVMMENLRGWGALKRSQALVRRSLKTATGAVFIMFLIPAVFSGLISFFVHTSVKAFDNTSNNIAVDEQQSNAENNSPAPAAETKEKEISISFGNNKKIQITEGENNMRDRVKHTVMETLIQLFWLPMHIFVTSFSSIIIALLYLKTRLAGGESMKELLEQFEETDRPRKKWQERVRNRLIQSGRITSNSSNHKISSRS
jgi:serine/threonine protein kinase